MERTKNATRNIFFGGIFKIVSLFVPFVVRTILINKLGVEYVGLGSLFTSILQVLNLAELGVSSAITYSMYGAIATNDEEKICQLMNYYKKIYRVVGSVIFAFGCIIAPFLRFFISGEIPDGINLFVLYFIYLFNTCLSYFLFAYKVCLFTAHQRNDVPSIVGTAVLLVTSGIQVVFLLLFSNYYLYVVVIPAMTIINNLVLALIASKMYPNYLAKGILSSELKADIKKKVSSLFIYKIGGIVLYSVDAIVISMFLGLYVLGKYNNYYNIMMAVFGLLDMVYTSLTAGVGNSIQIESKSKNKEDFDRLTSVQGWIICWFSSCLLCLYQPFMRLWVGEELMFPLSVVICLTALFFVWRVNDVVSMYKDAAGLWEYDKWRHLVAAGVNLILNLLLVRYIGIYGIIISTFASMVIIIIPWSSFVLFKYYFNAGNYKKEFLKYVLKVLFFALIALFSSLATYLICNLIPGQTIGSFVLKVLICIFAPNIILICIFPFFKEFYQTKEWIKLRIKHLLGK